jgi:gamma-glutamylputrescine oxidase
VTKSLPASASTAPIWGLLPPLPAGVGPPRRAEVCIVGGGISGVAALHWCRAAGLDAVLLERRHLGAGASGRNAGFLLAGVAENYARAAATLGRGTAREVWEFTRENHHLTRELLGSAAAGYARRGSWTLAADEAEAASLQEAAALLAEDALPGRWTGALPGHLAHLRGGLLNPEDGEVDPLLLLAAIAAPYRHHIHEGVAVLALNAVGDEVVVAHSAGETRAHRVIAAVNAWTSELLPEVRIDPVRAQMLATAAAPVGRCDRPAYAEWGYRYWRQLEDGRVLVGGMRHRAREEEVGTVAEPTARVQVHLDGELRELGIEAPVTHRWAGIMGFSPDGLPLVGPAPSAPAVLLLAGHSGHGLGFAVHAARRLAAFVAAGELLPEWLNARRAGASASPPHLEAQPGGGAPQPGSGAARPGTTRPVS